MKTNLEILKKRGFLTNDEAEPFFLYSKEQLLALLKDKLAVNRTAALFALRNFVAVNELDGILLEMLVKEKALYTKLEICDILATGNVLTIEKMVPYIGRIGNNQYTTIPKMISKKKSYPLPRDIIARTMAKMTPENFNAILALINHYDNKVVAEAIDAIGWQVFYHQELATDENYQVILKAFERYRNNPLITWKLIICLSAFNQSISFLKQLIPFNEVVKLEIKRTLALIKRRKKL